MPAANGGLTLAEVRVWARVCERARGPETRVPKDREAVGPLEGVTKTDPPGQGTRAWVAWTSRKPVLGGRCPLWGRRAPHPQRTVTERWKGQVESR